MSDEKPDLPKMVIIFRSEGKGMTCGQKCAFAAHSASWLSYYLDANRIAFCRGDPWTPFWGNEYGVCDLTQSPGLDENFGKDIVKNFADWCCASYRKIVLETDRSIEDVFNEFKAANIPCYLQKSAHANELNRPMCVAAFGLNSQLDPLTKGLECKLLR